MRGCRETRRRCSGIHECSAWYKSWRDYEILAQCPQERGFPSSWIMKPCFYRFVAERRELKLIDKNYTMCQTSPGRLICPLHSRLSWKNNVKNWNTRVALTSNSFGILILRTLLFFFYVYIVRNIKSSVHIRKLKNSLRRGSWLTTRYWNGNDDLTIFTTSIRHARCLQCGNLVEHQE